MSKFCFLDQISVFRFSISVFVSAKEKLKGTDQPTFGQFTRLSEQHYMCMWSFPGRNSNICTWKQNMFQVFLIFQVQMQTFSDEIWKFKSKSMFIVINPVHLWCHIIYACSHTIDHQHKTWLLTHMTCRWISFSAVMIIIVTKL